MEIRNFERRMPGSLAAQQDLFVWETSSKISSKLPIFHLNSPFYVLETQTVLSLYFHCILDCGTVQKLSKAMNSEHHIWPSLYLSTTQSWWHCIGRALMPKDRSSPHFNSVNHILNSHFYLRLGYLNIVALILGGRFFNIMWLPLKWMGSQMMMTIDADQFGEH